MSLFTVTSRLCALKPRVRLRDDILTARTSLPLQFLTLFSYAKYVTVDPHRRAVTVRRRWFWALHTSRTIPFDQVAYVTYDIRSFGTGWSFFTSEGFGRTDEWERYKVGLALNTGRHLHLFTFSGEGAVETGIIGTVFGGDDLVDLRGDQDEASYDFVRLLRHMLPVGVNGPLPGAAPDAEEQPATAVEITLRYQCRQCRRHAAPNNTTCPHCGGLVEAVPS